MVSKEHDGKIERRGKPNPALSCARRGLCECDTVCSPDSPTPVEL